MAHESKKAGKKKQVHKKKTKKGGHKKDRMRVKQKNSRDLQGELSKSMMDEPVLDKVETKKAKKAEKKEEKKVEAKVEVAEKEKQRPAEPKVAPV